MYEDDDMGTGAMAQKVRGMFADKGPAKGEGAQSRQGSHIKKLVGMIGQSKRQPKAQLTAQVDRPSSAGLTAEDYDVR